MGDATDDPEAAPGPDRPRGWRRPRRWASAIVLSLLVVGPWPVGEPRANPEARLREASDRIGSLSDRIAAGPIRVGAAEVDLAPSRPVPLAGFIGQVGTPYVGVDSPCLGGALTVEPEGEPGRALTVVTADLLLIDAGLARAISERSGVGLDRLYFTASHTHGGPGGWGAHPLEWLVAGRYDPEVFDALADRLASAVRRSRASTVPAEVALVRVDAPGRQVNRVEKGSPTHDRLSGLVFRARGAAEGATPLAILAVFGAHATVSHPIPPRLGGDYPAALVAALKRRTGAPSVFFASGAVGDASPSRPKARTQAESARILGEGLADDLLKGLPGARFDPRPELGSAPVAVDLGPLRLPFLAPWLRFSPIATWWIAQGDVPLRGLRVGPAVLIGFPGDYSGHLAARLEAPSIGPGVEVIATSFDGDFRGYLVSATTFRDRPCYETRWMSFYGPRSGDDLTDLGRSLAGRLAGVSARPEGAAPAFGPRWIGLATLIVVAIGLRSARLGLATTWRGLDLVSRGMLGFGLGVMIGGAIAPLTFAWASFGVIEPARRDALAVGMVLALWAPGRAGGRKLLALGLALAIGAASWPMVLGTVRAALMMNAGNGRARGDGRR